MRSLLTTSVSLAMAFGCAGLLAACQLPGKRPPRNVVLVVVDTLRADRLGERFTPALNRWAQQGAVFEQAWTNGDWTRIAIPTLLSGLWVAHHGSWVGHQLGVEEVFPMPDALELLPERLRAAGYHTVLATEGGRDFGFYDRAFNLGQGFDEVLDPIAASDTLTMPWSIRQKDEIILARAAAWLDSYTGSQPFFLYVHIGGAHSPYDTFPPDQPRFLNESQRAQVAALQADGQSVYSKLVPAHMADEADASHIRAMYSGAAWTTDRLLERLLSRLPTTGPPWLAVVVSDHGEGLWERPGVLVHGAGLAPAQVRIPMIWVAPGLIVPTRVGQWVQLADVYPTVCGLLGIECPPGLDGRDLSPLVLGRERRVAPAPILVERNLQYSEKLLLLDPYGLHYRGLETATACGYIDMSPLGLFSCRENMLRGFGVTEEPHRALYDLRSDPDAVLDLRFVAPDAYRRLLATLRDVTLWSMSGWAFRLAVPTPRTFELKVHSGARLMRVNLDRVDEGDPFGASAASFSIASDSAAPSASVPSTVSRWVEPAQAGSTTSSWHFQAPVAATASSSGPSMRTLRYGVRLERGGGRGAYALELRIGADVKVSRWFAADSGTEAIWDSVTIDETQTRTGRVAGTLTVTRYGNLENTKWRPAVTVDPLGVALSSDGRLLGIVGEGPAEYALWLEPLPDSGGLRLSAHQSGTTFSVEIQSGSTVSSARFVERVDLELPVLAPSARLPAWRVGLPGGRLVVAHIGVAPVSARSPSPETLDLLRSLGYIRE